ncbi:hypothetical protein ACEN9D_02955 [Pseudomonas sp. CT11-2]|uniref:hypothetical protein n=1 Tax=unclassified Pseudomonas TaxID=196821 RepID=UPI001D28740B|nr:MULTISPECIES: hypothetical protein [unclassified Pseudomonas]UVM35521.1 hypothetical protein LOY36_12760 [Pseudomonas sp. B21-019]CAH0203619.1 hypothetical protein SRABI130_02072 [Pseudomonas sp. Bi130]
MKTTFRFCVMLVGLASLPALILEQALAREQAMPSTQASNLSCQPPSTAPVATASQDQFDQYSWQMFIALNWPAQDGQRGDPDCAKQPGDPGYTVWQTYKTVEEIFLPKGADPGPWNTPQTAKSLGIINIAALKNSTQVNAVDQAVGGWLIDQAGNPTYYDISANETSYDYIVNNSFYNADVVSKANNINFPNGVIEVKSSWRILTTSDNASRYLTMLARVPTFNDQGQRTGVTEAYLGLVGLHIITKVNGYPQWIWSTFEQIDNVPPKELVHGQWVDQPTAGMTYSYFNPAAPAITLNQSPCDWQTQGTKLVCVPKPGTTFQTPNPLNRVTPIAEITNAVNTNYRTDPGLQRSVLKYYQLITTQRPLMPDNPSNPLGQPTPSLSANVTMESYIQPNSSCMNCHSMATPVKSPYKADFSYMFKFANAPVGKTTKDEE